MDRARIVDYYLSKIDRMDFNILEIRQEMETNGIPEEEIRIVVRLVDNEIHRRLAGKSKAGKVNATFLVGAVVTLIGLVITIGTYTGLINMGNYFLLAYGPILGGLAIMFGGLKRDGERVRDKRFQKKQLNP